MNKILSNSVVFYPESAPPDWEHQLLSVGIGFQYILHDKDVYSDGEHKGEPKKEHIHLLFQDIVSAKQKKYVSNVLKVPVQAIKPVNFPASAEKYLTHDTDDAKKDNKYLYSKDIIRYSPNFCQDAWERLKEQEKPPIKRVNALDVYSVIIEHNNVIHTFADLILYIQSNYEIDEANCLCNYATSHAVAVDKFIFGINFKKKQSLEEEQ